MFVVGSVEIDIWAGSFTRFAFVGSPSAERTAASALTKPAPTSKV